MAPLMMSHPLEGLRHLRDETLHPFEGNVSLLSHVSPFGSVSHPLFEPHGTNLSNSESNHTTDSNPSIVEAS